MEVRSPLTQKQWNSNVSSTAPKVQAEKNTADKFKVLSALPPKSTAPLWKNMGTASPWNSTSTTSAQNISKQTERKIPAKSEPDFEKDFKEMWAEYGPRLMVTERTPKTSYGPNSEMANTVKINPQKNTVSKTVASTKQIVSTAGPSAEMGKVVKTGRKTVSDNIIDLSPPHYMTMFEYIDWINGIGPNKETASSVKRESSADLVASAQPKSPFQNPVLGYNDMINPPDEKYVKSDEYWKNKAAKANLIKTAINAKFPVKPAEIEKIMSDPVSYIPHTAGMLKIRNSEKSAANTRNKVFTEYVGGYDGYGLNIDGGLPNAFLHIYLAAKTTDELGEKAAREFLTAHETFTDKQYDNGFLYKQDDISFDLEREYQKYEKYAYDKKYPLVKNHVEMDLHNNDIGIQIALSTPENPEEIKEQLESMLWEHETLEDMRTMFDGYSDRELLFIKKALDAVYGNEAAVIWDFPGNNLPE